MDVCDPNTSIKEIREAVRRNTGLDDVNLTREQICDIKSRIDGGLILAPPLMLSSDRKFMRDPKTPLSRSDYEKLFNSVTKKASLVRLAKKVRVAIDEDESTKDEILDAIHSKLRLLKIADPIELAKRTKRRTRAVNTNANVNANANANANNRVNNNSAKEPNTNANNRMSNNSAREPNANANNRMRNDSARVPNANANNRRPPRRGGLASFLFGSQNRRRRQNNNNNNGNYNNRARPQPREPRRSLFGGLFGGNANANARRVSWEQNSRRVREARRRIEQQQDEFERRKRDMGRKMNNLRDETAKFKRERDRRDDEIRYLRRQQYNSREERAVKDAKIKQAEQKLKESQVKLEMAKQTREKIQNDMKAQKAQLDNKKREFERNKRLLQNKMKEQAKEAKRDKKRLEGELARAKDPTEKRELEERLKNATNKLVKQKSEFENQEKRRSEEANRKLKNMQDKLNAASDPTEKNSLRQELTTMKERTRREKEESNRRIKELEGEIASRPTVFVPTPSAPTPVVTPLAPPATPSAPTPSVAPSAPASTNNNSNNNAPPTPKPTNNARPTPKPANNAPANNAESEAVKKIRGLRLPRNLEKSIIKRFRYNNVNTVVTLARETKRLQDQVNRLSNLTPRDRAEFIGKMLKDGNYDTVLGEARKKNNETREGKKKNAARAEQTLKESKEKRVKEAEMLKIARGDRAYLQSYMSFRNFESASNIDEKKLRAKVVKDMKVAELKAAVAEPRGLFGAAPRPKLVYISPKTYDKELQNAENKKKEKENRNKQIKKKKEDKETEAKRILNDEKGDLPLYERQRLYAAWSRNRNIDELKKQVESRVKVFQLSKNNTIGWSVAKIDKEAKGMNVSDPEFGAKIRKLKMIETEKEAKKKNQAEARKVFKQEEKEKARKEKAAEKLKEAETREREKKERKNKEEANRSEAAIQKIRNREARGKEISARISESPNLNTVAKNRLIENIAKDFQGRKAEQWMKNGWEKKVNARIKSTKQKENREKAKANHRKNSLQQVRNRDARGKEISARIEARTNLNAVAKNKLIGSIAKDFKGKKADQWMRSDWNWRVKVDERIELARRNAKLAELKRKAGGRVSKAGRGGQWTDKTIEEAAKSLNKKVVNLTVNDLQKIEAKAQKTNMEQRAKEENEKKRVQEAAEKVRATAEQTGVSERFITKLVRERGMTRENFEQRIAKESTKIANAKKAKEAADKAAFLRKLNKFLKSKNTTFNQQLKQMRNGFITDYDRDPSQKRRLLNEARREQATREKKLKSQHVKKTAKQKAAVKQAEQNEIKRRGERGVEIAARISASKNLNAPAKEKLRKAIERNFKRKRVEQWMANDWQVKVNGRINEEAKKAAAKAEREAKKAAAKAEREARKAAAKAQKEAKEAAAKAQKEAKEAKATANAKEAAAKAKATANAKEAAAKANATIKQTNSFNFSTRRGQDQTRTAKSRESLLPNNGNSGASTNTKKKRSQGRGFRVGGSSVRPRKKSSSRPSVQGRVQRRVQGYEKMTREAQKQSKQSKKGVLNLLPKDTKFGL
tara:strand:- start:2930 stop:7561 length:4632 start_codon:yes stop_codon:yes gene_type:complete